METFLSWASILGSPGIEEVCGTQLMYRLSFLSSDTNQPNLLGESVCELCLSLPANLGGALFVSEQNSSSVSLCFWIWGGSVILVELLSSYLAQIAC